MLQLDASQMYREGIENNSDHLYKKINFHRERKANAKKKLI